MPAESLRAPGTSTATYRPASLTHFFSSAGGRVGPRASFRRWTKDRGTLAERSVRARSFQRTEEGLGDLTRMIIVDIAYKMSDQFLDTHISILKRSGAEILVFAGVPANAAADPDSRRPQLTARGDSTGRRGRAVEK
jgi:hypothetical protein